MTMTINNVGRLELSRFYGIFGIVSTDLRHILLILVAIDIYALLKSLSKKCALIVQIGGCVWGGDNVSFTNDKQTVLLVGEGIPYHGDPVMKGSCHLLPHFAGCLKYLSPGCLRLFLPEPIFLPCSAGLLTEKSRHQGLVTSTLYSAKTLLRPRSI